MARAARSTRRPSPPAARGKAAVVAAQRRPAQGESAVELDRVIHERVRLAIVSALAGAESLSFNALKELLQITDGNLSVHARRLEEAGFVACEKSFVERVPRTEYRLTPAGRKALDAYLEHMEALIQRVRES